MNKKELRKRFLDIRNAMELSEVEQKSKCIISKLLGSQSYKNSNIIMTYVDFRNEVKTRDFIRYALRDGKRVAVPITDFQSNLLIVSEIRDIDRELGESRYGNLEPKECYVRKINPYELDLILVPGVVFDTRGYRIGYGGGYYDRFLTNIRPNAKTVGICFDFQVVDKIQEESFDKPVHSVITEERIIGYEYSR